MGERKNELFNEALDRVGPEVYPDAIEAIGTWKREGFRIAVASSSKNSQKILRRAGIAGLFDVTVDGVYLERAKLSGKPAPDLFLAAARLLAVLPSEAAVLEDAVAGIQAARAGGFAQVIGVARTGQAQALLRAGADLTVARLTELLSRNAA